MSNTNRITGKRRMQPTGSDSIVKIGCSLACGSSRKGFVFTLLVLVVIVFMLMELNIYFRTYELRQESEPNKIRSQVISEIAGQFSSQKLSRTAGVPLYAAVYQMAVNSSSPPSSANLANITWGAAWNGTRIDLSGQSMLSVNSTLSYWDSKMKQIASSMNFGLNTSYGNFSIGQSNPWAVTFNFTVSFNLTDEVSKVRIASVNPVSVNLSIIGMEDPLVSRAFQNTRRSISIASSQPLAQKNATGAWGRGFFYGTPVFVRSQGDIVFSPDNKKMIMVTNIKSLADSYGNVYGAVVLVGNNNLRTAGDFIQLSVPIFANESMSMDSIPTSPFLILSDNDSRVTGTESGNFHSLYTIGTVTDMSQCGSYVARPNKGYSFLSRLTNNYVADQMGIETLVGGAWLPAGSSIYSSVDREYLNSQQGSKVIGMPGCHDLVTCRYPTTPPLPMRLSQDAATFYGVSDLLCPSSRCG